MNIQDIENESAKEKIEEWTQDSQIESISRHEPFEGYFQYVVIYSRKDEGYNMLFVFPIGGEYTVSQDVRGGTMQDIMGKVMMRVAE